MFEGFSLEHKHAVIFSSFVFRCYTFTCSAIIAIYPSAEAYRDKVAKVRKSILGLLTEVVLLVEVLAALMGAFSLSIYKEACKSCR